MISLKVKVNGQLREIETRARNLSDLTLPMQQWNKYKRQDVQRIFDEGGPGWPDKVKGAKYGPQTANAASAAEARLRAVADNLMRIKLRAELRRAQRRYARGKGNESKSAATVARRYAVLRAFEQLASGGTVQADFSDQKLVKSVIGLRDRMARASIKASTKPLGRMASSIKSKVEKYSVAIYSTIPWSNAHNEGATVGRGAKLPKREFLNITEQDLAVLNTLINLYVASGG